MNNCKLHQVHLWHFDINSTHHPDDYWHYLTKAEQQRAHQFHFIKDKNAFIFSRGGLRLLLSRYLAVAPTDIQFTYNEYGKPFLESSQNKTQIAFNVSHSHHCILYAITPKAAIGIDVEQIRTDVDHESIAQNFFSVHECQQLRMATPDEKIHLFYNIWTAKEAFIKAIGKGLSYPLADFTVSITQASSTIQIIENEPDAQKEWLLHLFNPTQDYVATLVTEQSIQEINHHSFP